MKHIVFVVDVRNWAFDNIAKYLQQLLANNYAITILYTEDYATYDELLAKIEQLPAIDLIHFFWRGYLHQLLHYIAAKDYHSNRQIIKFLSIATITGIPDHLFLTRHQDITEYLPLFWFVDNYYAVSTKLMNIYRDIQEYPKPWPVAIFDNIIPIPLHQKIKSDKLKIVWIGNSAWGKWHADTIDPKGFETVITPIAEAFANHPHIEICLLDSQIKKRSKEEIFAELASTDILLIAANTDGTPLPLIEAMAYGCAVISSDTGIVAEVLPTSQQPYILPRDAQQFIAAIKQLHENPALLQQLKDDNHQQYLQLFCNNEHFIQLWSEFIEATTNKTVEAERIKYKQQILASFYKDEKIIVHKQLLKRFLLNKHIKKALIFIVYRSPTLVKFSKWCLSKLKDNSIYKSCCDDIAKIQLIKDTAPPKLEDNLCSIYGSAYPGVAHSTTGLFAHRIKLPGDVMALQSSISPESLDDVIQRLLKANLTKIVISGGDAAFNFSLIDRINITHPGQFTIAWLWHGSPAQWVDMYSGHPKLFNRYHELYKKGYIQAIITLKKDLEHLLAARGITTYLLQNFIPQQPTITANPFNPQTSFKVGMWSAYHSWIKNLPPQILGLSMLGEQIEFYTNYLFTPEENWWVENIAVTHFPAKLPREELMGLMQKTQLTLYLTCSECSPMIALESLGMNIPCLVGPSSDLYGEDDYLRDMLTVNRIDCPTTISKAILNVRDNYQAIIARLPQFVKNYNNRAEELKIKLLQEL